MSCLCFYSSVCQERPLGPQLLRALETFPGQLSQQRSLTLPSTQGPFGLGSVGIPAPGAELEKPTWALVIVL